MNLKINYHKIKKYVLLKNGLVYDPFLQFDKKIDILIVDGIIEKISNKISEKSNYHIIDCPRFSAVESDARGHSLNAIN